MRWVWRNRHGSMPPRRPARMAPTNTASTVNASAALSSSSQPQPNVGRMQAKPSQRMSNRAKPLRNSSATTAGMKHRTRSITAASIRGLESQGALDVASGQSVTLTATSGSIGQTPGTPATLEDPVGLITLLNGTGQGGAAVNVNFVSGQTAWFGVRSKESFQGLGISESSGLNSSTFGCDATSCFNILGQTTALADSVIANILNAAAQDAADAAFGTENLDFAIRKGYVTTIGRVPPGIDEIAGDLGSTQCDTRVTSSTSVAADKACSAPAPVPAQKAEAPAPAVPTLSAKGNLIVY